MDYKSSNNLEQPVVLDDLADGEVLLNLKHSTICNSDVHTLLGRRQEPVPSILGHEGCGTIFISKRPAFVAGDRVTFSVADVCGQCKSCQKGPSQKCVKVFKYGHARHAGRPQGCYSSHIVLKAGTCLVKLPMSLSLGLSTPVNCALATMVAVRRAAANALGTRVRAGRCLIFGAGFLGIYGAALMNEAGMEVYITDISMERIKNVSKYGAMGGLLPGQIDQHRYDLIIEACGVGKVVETGVPLLQPGGAIVLVGSVTPNTSFTITAESLIRKCASLVGVHNYAAIDLEDAVCFLEKTAAKYPFGDLISPPMSLSKFEEAYQLALTNKYLRVLLDNNI